MRKNHLIVIAFLCLFPWGASAGTISKPANNTGLVGYWNFDVGKGTARVYDMSGNRSNGTFTSMEPSSDWIEGKVGQGIRTDGSDEYVNLGDPTNNVLDPGSGSFTWSFWVKTTDDATSQTWPGIVAKEDSGAGSRTGWVSTLSTSGGFINYITCEIFVSGTQDSANSGKVLNDGSWHHVTCVRDIANTDIYMYVDGVLVGTDTSISTGSASNSTQLWFGCRTQSGVAAGLCINGSIDEVRIYNRALSAAEAARLYRMSAPKYNASSVGEVTNGLIGHWTFDGNDMTPKVIDRSGQNNHLTLSGFTSTTTVIGRLGQALQLDGTDDYVRGLTSYSTLEPSLPVSFSGWFKASSFTTTADGLITYREGTEHNGYWGAVGSDGSLQISYGNDTACGATSRRTKSTATSLVTSGQWFHFAGVLRGPTDMTIYLNGVDVGGTYSGSGGNIAYDANSFLNVGRMGGGVGCTVTFFDGQADDVRVYNRALSAVEVVRLYQIGAPSKISTTPVGNANLKNGLVGHFTFDGKDTLWANGRTLDLSGQGNHSNLTNMSTTTSPTIGKLGQALQFDGSDDLVNAGSGSSVDNVFQGGGTISAWIKPAGWGEGSFGRIANKASDTGAANGFFFSVNNSTAPTQSLRFGRGFSSVAGAWNTPANSIVLERWQHVVVVYNENSDTNDALFYINGALSATTETNTPSGSASSDAAQTLYIGNHSDETRTFAGSLDDVRIYDRPLSSDEVKQLYNLGR